MLAAERAKLKCGQWLDYLPQPLESVADVDKLFRMVEEKKAALRAAAMKRASRN
jgi:hypothetical protein